MLCADISVQSENPNWGLNDELGHKAGDELLLEVSRRLTACICESGISARLGGDEFTMALSNLESALVVEVVANKILQALKQPFALTKKYAPVSPAVSASRFFRHMARIPKVFLAALTARCMRRKTGAGMAGSCMPRLSPSKNRASFSNV